MEQNRAFVVLILLIFFFFPKISGPDYRQRAHKAIAQERYSLEVLRNSTFGSPGNLTGLLLLGDNDGSGRTTPPEVVREKWRGMRSKVLREFVTPGTEDVLRLADHLPVYSNATGSVLGDWEKVVMAGLPTTVMPNVTFPHNLTQLSAGSMTLSMEETTEPVERGGVGQVKVTMRVRNPDGGTEVDVSLKGVHFADTGEMVAATTSEKFSGFYALPHFMVYEAGFNQSKQLLVPAIEKVVKKMEETSYLDAPWLPNFDPVTPSEPQCEYVVYVQLLPIDYLLDGRARNLAEAAAIIRAIEREMRFPTGASLPPPPPLEAMAIVYSPNCGFIMVAKQLVGQKVEPFYTKASNFGLGAAVVATAQAWLLIRQMNESNTLSTISRVSFWTIAIMAVVDGYFFFSFMIMALFLKACFLPTVAASFFYLMLSAVFGMRFLVTTYRVQRQPVRQSTQATPTPTPAPAPTSTVMASPPGPDSLPIPSTAVPQSPVIIPPNQPANADDDVDSEIGALHTRFYFALLAILFFTLHAATWPPYFRDLLLHAFLLLINSYWVPQIYRNVMRGCRKAFQWEFIFGMSACRLAGVFYIYLYPHNIFRVDPNPEAAAVIVGWVWIQCMALLSQDVFGPRFLVPSRSLPPVYDYHAVLPANDEESAQEMGTPVDRGRRRGFDCVVCMQTVEVPTGGSGGGGGDGDGGVGLLERRAYMITPCKHVFHSHCLEGWMRFRLQCPICRDPLPAL